MAGTLEELVAEAEQLYAGWDGIDASYLAHDLLDIIQHHKEAQWELRPLGTCWTPRKKDDIHKATNVVLSTEEEGRAWIRRQTNS